MIYLDVSAAVHSRAGLGRYSEQLAHALIATDPQRFSIFYCQNRGTVPPNTLKGIPYNRIKLGYKPWRMAVLMAHLSGQGFNRLLPDAELYHSMEHLLMPMRNVPTVLTVHDLIFKLFPEYHKKLNYWYLNWAVPIFCRNASAIIAVSEATKRDIVQHYGTDPDKIHVVHEAAADNFKVPQRAKISEVKHRYELPEQFLLHISTIEPRKNLSRLVDAVKILRNEHPELKLLLVGSKGWLYDDFFAKLETEGLTEVVRHLGWVPDEDLPAIIASASLGVQPSIYEGFGLPLLEHMACGQVVAASNASSFPEVGGEAAAYFDPKDVDDMAAVIGRILSSPQEYAERKAQSTVQAAKFSWQRAAQQTLAVYDQIL